MNRYPYTWEQAIEILRKDPRHEALIRDSYLTADVHENARRFADSEEFAEVLRIIREQRPDCSKVLDLPGGNGIASFAFAKAGYAVSVVEPDPSASVGRGAIEAVLRGAGLQADVVNAYGEQLPFGDESFDVVYVRQGLHHARDLPQMVSELARVLKRGGTLAATREHVVDDYGSSLQAFLDSQVDHQLYGGEHAFTLRDYRAAFAAAGLETVLELGPYDSPINVYPNTPATLQQKILASGPGRLLGFVLPKEWVTRLGMWRLRSAKMPGRLYSFVMRKEQ